MGEGDVLNSTMNVPQASSTDRFANMNPDRCVSEPQIDLIGFNEDVTGGQLETRIRTRSRGFPDYTDNSRRVIHDEGLNDHHSTEISMEGCSTENVFVDDFIVVDECLDSGKREEPNLSRIIQRDCTRNTESVMVCGLEPLQVNSPAVLSHHQGVTNLRARQDQYDEQLGKIRYRIVLQASIQLYRRLKLLTEN